MWGLHNLSKVLTCLHGSREQQLCVQREKARRWPVWLCQLASGDQRSMQKDILRGADSASCQKQRAAEIVSMCVQALTDQRLHPELVLASPRPGLSGRGLYFRLLTQRQPDSKRTSRRYAGGRL